MKAEAFYKAFLNITRKYDIAEKQSSMWVSDEDSDPGSANILAA